MKSTEVSLRQSCLQHIFGIENLYIYIYILYMYNIYLGVF